MVKPDEANPYDPPQSRSAVLPHRNTLWLRIVRWVGLIWLVLFAMLLLELWLMRFVTSPPPVWMNSLFMVLAIGTGAGFILLMLVSLIAVVVAISERLRSP